MGEATDKLKAAGNKAAGAVKEAVGQQEKRRRQRALLRTSRAL
jgi:uncharacterized protein YjbJ (UPF0337 family)